MARYFLQSNSQLMRFMRFFSGGKEGSLNKIILSDDKSTFIAWHPERNFPYECTRPLPSSAEDSDTSALKTKLTPELLEVFNKKTPEEARLELMNLTHTTKHRWFPRPRDKKKRKLEMDRKYL